MTLRTVTYDDSTHKLLPIRPTLSMVHAALEQNRSRKNTAAIAPFGFELFILFGEAYLAMIAAAPEYQEPTKDDQC